MNEPKKHTIFTSSGDKYAEIWLDGDLFRMRFSSMNGYVITMDQKAVKPLFDILQKMLSEKVVGTELRVCEDIAKRQLMGIQKYKTTVEENPLTLQQWLQHAYEECLDQAVYLRRAIEEIDRG